MPKTNTEAAGSNQDQTVTIDLKPVLMPVSIIISAIIIGISMIISASSLGGSGFKIAGATTNTATGANGTITSAAAGTREVEFEVALDDDAISGNKNASIAILEFAAYDCPFCDRHFTQVYPELKKQYVDTGKVFMVYRDSPLSGPEQIQANAAECARKQGGDSAYYQFHDYLFSKFYADTAKTSRTAWNVDLLKSYSSSIGLNGDQLASCINNKETVGEVTKDQGDLQALATQLGLKGLGVPTFIIGKVENGKLKGKVTVDTTSQSVLPGGAIINGAYPLDTFQGVINKLL